MMRPRILRKNQGIRNLVREVQLSVDDFMIPIFIEEGKNICVEIPSMPDYYRYSLDRLSAELDTLWDIGFRAVLLFCKVPDDLKDNEGKEAINPDGLMQRSIRHIKKQYPEMVVMTDVALDPYSIYGHDGVVKDNQIVNDQTIEILAKMSVSHATAGADFVAPSDMMDGRVGAIRTALEQANFPDVGIMSYTAKYASSFYGPFRQALDSSPGFGDKKTYQMDFANRREAIREAKLDEQEGADILMVKPATAYLDIIRDIRETTSLPVAAYQVSGTYSMIKVAAKNGVIDYDDMIWEQLTAIKRAGANIIVSYFAKDIAKAIMNR